MSKLFVLKEWYSLPDAAERLSISFDEDVTEADVLQLALEGRIRLSLQILNNVYARRLYKKSKDEIEYEEIEYTLPIEADPGQKIRTERRPVDGEIMHLPALCGNDEVFQLGLLAIVFQREFEGRHVVDLLMSQSSRSYLLQYLDYVCGRLNEPIERAADWLVIQEKSGDLWRIESYGENLAGDVEVVVRAQAIRDLEQSLDAGPGDGQEKQLSTRERDTLLTLIAVMAKECYKHEPNNRSKSAVSEILQDVQKAGLSISDQTIRDKLKEAWALLPGEPRKS